MVLPTKSSPSHLCSTCSSIFSRANAIEGEIHADGRIPLPVGKPTYNHHQNLTDFKKSVAGKCYICVRLWREMYPTADMSELMSFEPARPVDIRYSLTTEDPQELARVHAWFIEGELNKIKPSLRGRYVVMPTKGKICPHPPSEEDCTLKYCNSVRTPPCHSIR